MKELIKLEIGAGKKPRTDFITCDIRALENKRKLPGILK